MTQRQKGPLLALVALVAVLGCAFVAYDWLSARVEAPASVAATEKADEGESGVQQDGDAASEVMLLADHDATVYTDLGEPVRLSAVADGRPLVINFWATWCPYCVDEMPDYLGIYEDYQDRVSFAFVDVTDGQRERAEDAQAWLSDNGYSSLPDYYDLDLEAVTSFGVWSYPTTVLVSAEGEVLTVSPGRIDAELLRGALNTLV